MIKKILKGVLLWVTLLLIGLVISSIDSILNLGFVALLAWILLCLALAYLCFTCITLREFYTLSGMKLIDNFIK